MNYEELDQANDLRDKLALSQKAFVAVGRAGNGTFVITSRNGEVSEVVDLTAEEVLGILRTRIDALKDKLRKLGVQPPVKDHDVVCGVGGSVSQ